MKEVGLEWALRMDRTWKGRKEKGFPFQWRMKCQQQAGCGVRGSQLHSHPNSQHSGGSAPISWVLVKPGVNAHLM